MKITIQRRRWLTCCGDRESWIVKIDGRGIRECFSEGEARNYAKAVLRNKEEIGNGGK